MQKFTACNYYRFVNLFLHIFCEIYTRIIQSTVVTNIFIEFVTLLLSEYFVYMVNE